MGGGVDLMKILILGSSGSCINTKEKEKTWGYFLAKSNKGMIVYNSSGPGFSYNENLFLLIYLLKESLKNVDCIIWQISSVKKIYIPIEYQLYQKNLLKNYILIKGLSGLSLNAWSLNDKDSRVIKILSNKHKFGKFKIKKFKEAKGFLKDIISSKEDENIIQNTGENVERLAELYKCRLYTMSWFQSSFINKKSNQIISNVLGTMKKLSSYYIDLDGLHLTSDGHRKLADLVYEKLI